MQRVVLLLVAFVAVVIQQSSSLSLRRELEAPLLPGDSFVHTADLTAVGDDPIALLEPVETTEPLETAAASTTGSASTTVEPQATLKQSPASFSSEGPTSEEDLSMAATEPSSDPPAPSTKNNSANAHAEGGGNAIHARHSGVNFGPVLVGAVGVVCVGVAAFFAQKRKLQS